MWDAEREGLPNLGKIVSIFIVVHRSEYGPRKDSTNDDVAHALQ